MTNLNPITTFRNLDKTCHAKAQEQYQTAVDALNSENEKFCFWSENGTELSEYEHFEKSRRDLLGEGFDKEGVRAIEAIQNRFNELGNFHDYGLEFSFKESTEDSEGYYCFLMSWGGGSDEIRFYEGGLVEYVYMDWSIGTGFDCTDLEGFEWIKSWFEGCDSLNFESLDPDMVAKKWEE
jgi:hypothetical protein